MKQRPLSVAIRSILIPALFSTSASLVFAEEIQESDIQETTVESTAEASQEASQETAPKTTQLKPGQTIEEIITTGTALKLEASQMAKQMVVLDSEALIAIGEPDLGRALARLPQNFGGMQQAGAFTATGGQQFSGGALNVNGAASVSLRGLGGAETLILVNGHRIGSSDTFGTTSDISGIPMSAIERVEILMDGASSVYGSDAVGGVINIILKDDYQGIELGLTTGMPRGDGGEEHTFSFGSSFSWETGHLTLGGEIKDKTKYLVSETQTSVGSQAGNQFLPVAPGNMQNQTDDEFYYAPEGEYNPTLADMTPGFLPAADGEYQSLTPDEESYAFSINVSQSITDDINLAANILHSKRDTEYDRGAVGASVTLFPDNPLNPFGDSFPGSNDGDEITVRTIWPALGIKQSLTETEQTSANLSLDWQFSENWSSQLSYNNARNKVDGVQTNGVNSNLLSLGGVAGFNPWHDGLAPTNTQAIYDQFLTGDRAHEAINRDEEIKLLLQGTPFTLPAGEVAASFGISKRTKELEQFRENPGGLTTNAIAQLGNQVGSPVDNLDAEQEIESFFVEAHIPLLSDANSRIDQLDLSLSYRTDDYDMSGKADAEETQSSGFEGETASLGIVFSPNEDWRFSWDISEGFVAPNMLDLFEPTIVTENIVRNWGVSPVISYYSRPWLESFLSDFVIDNFVCIGDNVCLDEGVPTELSGGNKDLEAQRSLSRKLMVQWTPIDDLQLEVAYSRIDYRDKIVSSADLQFHSNSWDIYPGLVEFDANGAPTVFASRLNLSREELRTMDYKVSYNLDTDFGNLYFQAIWSHVTLHEQQVSSATEAINFINITSPKRSGSLDIGWTYDNWSVNLNSLYRGGYANGNALFAGEVGRSWTVYESTMRHNLGVTYAFDSGFMNNGSVSLRVLNLSDEKTDATTFSIISAGEMTTRNFKAGAVGDPRGRMIFIDVRKTF